MHWVSGLEKGWKLVALFFIGYGAMRLLGVKVDFEQLLSNLEGELPDTNIKFILFFRDGINDINPIDDKRNYD